MPRVRRRRVRQKLWSNECRKAFDPAEFEFGSAFAFFFISGSIVASSSAMDYENVNLGRTLFIAITEGFLYSTMVETAQEISYGRSGYLNPSISFALFLLHASFTEGRKRYWQFTRMLLLVISQILAAIAASFLVYYLIPFTSDGQDIPGIGALNPDQTTGAAFVLEMICSMFTVYIVLSTRVNEQKKCSWIIAFAVMACKIVAFPLTGGCLNPARYFGAMLFAPGDLSAAWMYLFAPFVGSVLGTGMFVLFRGSDLHHQ